MAMTLYYSAEEDMEVLEKPYTAAVQNTLLILVAGAAVSGAGILMNLRQEPMNMFGSRKE